MPLTTVARGRVFDWSHAVGRGAARGTGFNYIQTMCLGKNGVIYTTNRGNENNFGMHAKKVQLGGTGAKFIQKWGTTGSGDGELLRPAGLAVEKSGNLIVADSGNNRLQVFGPDG